MESEKRRRGRPKGSVSERHDWKYINTKISPESDEKLRNLDGQICENVDEAIKQFQKTD